MPIVISAPTLNFPVGQIKKIFFFATVLLLNILTTFGQNNQQLQDEINQANQLLDSAAFINNKWQSEDARLLASEALNLFIQGN